MKIYLTNLGGFSYLLILKTNIHSKPFGLRFCSLIENSELGIDQFNDFFSTFISLPDRIGNITQTAFPKFLRFLLKCKINTVRQTFFLFLCLSLASLRSFYTDVLCESFRDNKSCNLALQKQMTIMNHHFKTAIKGTSIFHSVIFQMKSNTELLKES